MKLLSGRFRMDKRKAFLTQGMLDLWNSLLQGDVGMIDTSFKGGRGGGCALHQSSKDTRGKNDGLPSHPTS